jgi:alkylhydroperoxidase family enzyme
MKLEDVKDPGHRVVIPLPADADLPADVVATLAASPPINVLRMFAGTQEMFPAVMAMVRTLFYSKDIEPRLREIIVLRCAHLLDCPYEWQANVVMARNAGLTDGEIAALRSDGPVESSDAATRLICTATDELTRTATLTDATLAALMAAHGPRLASKYILAVGWFNLLSRFLNGTRVPLESADKLKGRTAPV